MMDSEQTQISDTMSTEIGEVQQCQSDPAGLMKDPTFTIVELSRDEMEHVAAAAPGA